MAAVGPAIESYRLEQARERAERAQPKARRFGDSFVDSFVLFVRSLWEPSA